MFPTSPRRTSRARRWLALLTVLVLGIANAPAASGVVVRPNTDPAEHAARWLTDEYRALDDPSASALLELISGLAATDAPLPLATELRADLEATASTYVGTPGNISPARAGKLLIGIAAVGADPSAPFGGRDYDDELRATLNPATGQAGTSGAFLQSLAVLGLARTEAGVPSAAGAYLASLQCSDGSFRFSGIPVAGICSGSFDPDTTALAATALRAGGRAVDAEESVDALVANQAGNGSFGANANSTGLAAQALRDGGETGAADSAAAFIRSLQKSTGDDAGAIRYTDSDDGGLLLATGQGVLAFGAPSYAHLAFPRQVGAPCASRDGVTVVVDLTGFAADRDDLLVRCAAGPHSSGLDALTAAFQARTTSSGYGPYVCAIEDRPDLADPCASSNPGYWSYWSAERGGTWKSSAVGAASSRPAPGSVEGWRFVPSYAEEPTPAAPRSSTFDALAPPATPATPDETPPAAAPTPSPATPATPASAPPDRADDDVAYGVVTTAGRVDVHGNGAIADLRDVRLNAPIVDAFTGPRSGTQVWLVGADGGVFTFGDARFHGSTGDQTLNRPIVTAMATPSGDGYWLVANDGGVFTFGDARFHGSTGDRTLNRPIVTAMATPSGDGYWLVASDGGVFTFGDARFHGSTGDQTLNRPIVTAMATPSADGYWLVASDGGVFTFGDAGFLGSMGDRPLDAPIIDATASSSGRGYRLAAADGGIFTFGDAPFAGSSAGRLHDGERAVGLIRMR